MQSGKQVRESLLIFVGVALAAGSANAQPLWTTHWTIEARVAQADHVIVGVIEKVSRKVIVVPGGPDQIGVIYPDGQFEYTVTLKIGKVLKGDLKGTVDDLGAIHSVGSDNRYEEWSKAQTPILWFLGPTPKPGARRHWQILPLGKRVAAEDLRLLLVLAAGLGISGAAADDAKDAAKKELDGLQGDWKLVCATRDGKDMPQDMVKALKCTIKGDKFTVARDAKAVEEGTLKLDTTKTPKEIDMALGEGKQTALGIYELSGDTYKLCYAPPGKDRPKEFGAKEGTGYTLSQWQREKK
jgi:uncharacterized protein (TIGR03067 family)